MQISEKLSIEESKKPAPALLAKAFTGEQPILRVESGETATTYLDKFQKSILDQAKDYPLPVPVINLIQNNTVIPLLTLKSLSMWQGKQKSKKTTLLALAIAAFITQEKSNDPIRFENAIPGKVLFFDNEQGESYAARTMKLILKLAGLETSPNLIFCDLREYSPTERIKIIEAGIESTPDVRLVVVDGIVDLLNDFMDASEGHLSITFLIKLCSTHNIHVAGVLHQNKNDKNARAHVGTISSQKCEIEISTEVDPDDRSQSIVTCVNSRGLPFEPFAIKWDKGSLPKIPQDWDVEKPKDIKAAKNFERSKELAEAIFKPFISLQFTQAVESIMQVTFKSQATAKRMLNDFKTWGLVEKGADGNYRRNTPTGSTVHEGSNEVHEPCP